MRSGKLIFFILENFPRISEPKILLKIRHEPDKVLVSQQ
jgi:hypothetical protein